MPPLCLAEYPLLVHLARPRLLTNLDPSFPFSIFCPWQLACWPEPRILLPRLHSPYPCLSFPSHPFLLELELEQARRRQRARLRNHCLCPCLFYPSIYPSLLQRHRSLAPELQQLELLRSPRCCQIFSVEVVEHLHRNRRPCLLSFFLSCLCLSSLGLFQRWYLFPQVLSLNQQAHLHYPNQTHPFSFWAFHHIPFFNSVL